MTHGSAVEKEKDCCIAGLIRKGQQQDQDGTADDAAAVRDFVSISPDRLHVMRIVTRQDPTLR